MNNTLKNIFQNFIKTTGKPKFMFILFFGIFVSLLTVLEPLFFAEIIKKLEIFYETGKFEYSELIEIVVYWIFFIIILIIISYYYRYNLVDKSILANYLDLNKEFSHKIINMSYNDFLNKKQGSIFKNLDRGIHAQFNFLFFIFSDLVKNSSGIIFIFIILVYINVKMAILTLLMTPVMIGAGYYFYAKLNPEQNKLNNKWDKIFGQLGDFITNLSLVKVLNLENVYGKSLKNDTGILYDKQLKISKGWSISDIYTQILVMISRVLVLGFGIYFVVIGDISLATLFLFFSYIGRIYFPLSFLFSKSRQIQESLTAVDKMMKEFNNLDNDNEQSGLKIKNIDGNIEFKDVSFKYNESTNIFKKLNFSITKGEKTAFVGNTGAGKSTIVNLILRFWDINSGTILIDGIDTKKINKQSLRKNIGVVSQENSLFNMTIKENLLFAKTNATKNEIETALKNAEATFVFDLEKGIDTIIGERGLKLSGGEKQRLSIARLFLKNPKILILDEATSALDNKTEKLIQKALDKLMIGRTSIIIAHRLSTIQNADKIFMLEHGKIVETGKYKELINKKAKFYNLANPEHFILG